MKKPNIILINCDDLGYGDLNCYGSEHNKTPHLDKMASEGIRFTDFYMASPVCSPSRGAMMTGCYPPRIGFGSFDTPCPVLTAGSGLGLNPKETTIASLLKKAGYATKLVGKWHCGDQPEFLPTRHGFDEYYGLPYSNDMGRQNGRANNPPPLPLLLNEEVIQEQPDLSALTERYVEQCVSFIRKNRNSPFFLYFAHMHVHRPIYAPQNFLEESENGRYGAGVAQVDWSTGVIFSELEKLGIDNDTLVIFTSDNGSRASGEGGSNAPLRGTKRTTWEGGMRVPCIMRWPGYIEAGQTCGEIVSSMDFYATFANLTGISVPDDRIIDSLDISSLLLEKNKRSPRDTFFYYYKNDLEAVRHDEWKLHIRKHGEKTIELYNLKEDISETKNIYNEHPEIVNKLENLLQSARNDTGDEALGIKGANCRPPGIVKTPRTLTEYNPEHPYFQAMYDLRDSG